MSFGPVLTAMVTPFNDKLEVDYKKAQELAEYLINNGSDGLVIAGTTGESPTLTFEEKVNLFKAVKEAVGDQGQVIAGTGSNNTENSIKLTKAAEKANVDGAMLVVPYYNKPPQEALYEHFKKVAQSTTLPIVLYNIPGRSSINLSVDIVKRLAEDVENIVAIKEAAGSMDQVSFLKEVLPSDFLIYSGDDSLTLPMLAIGAHGVISVASHLVGNDMQEMITNFKAGDVEKARNIHLRLLPLFKNLFITANPIPVKAALNLLGKDVGGLRLPLVAATDKEKAIVEETMRKLNIF